MSIVRFSIIFSVLAASLPTLAWGDPALPPVLKDVGVVENLNQSVPKELSFLDTEGRSVQLRELFRDEKPVVLTLVYYRCPMLCNLVLSGLARSLQQTGMKLGVDYRAVTVSIDPSEGPELAAETKRGYLQALGAPATSADWAFLTGQAPAIHALAEAVGFKYAYDASTQQFAHSAVSFVLTPEGRISRYLYGLETHPRDLRLSLVEAAGRRVGTSVDRLLLTCYRYDPASRKYGFFVRGFLQTGGMAVFVLLSGLLTVLWRRELRRSR